MTALQRQYVLLAGLVVVLGGVMTWQFSAEDDPAGTGGRPSNSASRRGGAGDAADVPRVEDVGIARLSVERDALEPVERNPFRFRPKPPPPPPPPAPRPVARPVQPVAPQVPAGPPPPPRITLQYIGYAEAGSAPRMGVFSDGRGLVVNAKEGDILEGRYRVLRVGTDSADLVYLDGRGRQTIPLRGQ